MDSLTPRPYESGDRESLIALWATVFPDDPARNAPEAMIQNKLRVQPELLLVCVSDGAVIGAIMAGFDGTRGWIHHLAVAASHRKRGVGTDLVAAAEEGLRGLGCPKVNLQIRPGNAEVIAFYERNGFESELRVSMGKVLSPSA